MLISYSLDGSLYYLSTYSSTRRSHQTKRETQSAMQCNDYERSTRSTRAMLCGPSPYTQFHALAASRDRQRATTHLQAA
jgi:hypothetical protein